MKAVLKCTAYFAEQAHAPNTQRLFMRASYAFLLLNALYFISIRDLMWGDYAMMMSWNPGSTPALNLAYLLDHRREWAIAGYFIYIACLVIAQLRIHWVLPRIVIFLGGVMLYYACLPAFNGVTLLYNLFAFFMIFMAPTARRPVRVMLSNLAFLACKVQLVMVYALTGGYKLAGHTWLEGSSIHYALQLDHYSPEWVVNLLLEKKGLLMVFNYFGLIYQLGFPIAIFIRKIRGAWLILGCIFHVSIAIGLHLPDFGIGMMVAYLLFIKEARAQAWLGYIESILPLGRKPKKTVAKTAPE